MMRYVVSDSTCDPLVSDFDYGYISRWETPMTLFYGPRDEGWRDRQVISILPIDQGRVCYRVASDSFRPHYYFWVDADPLVEALLVQQFPQEVTA